MLNASASSVKTGDEVIVTQRIPSRVLKDQPFTASFSDIRDGTSNTLGLGEIPRGTIGRVIDTRVGEVHVGFFFGSDNGVADFTFKDHDFEKYFAEWL